MIKAQILWDVRARLWMKNNRSSVVDSFNRDLRAILEREQWFEALSEVGSLH